MLFLQRGTAFCETCGGVRTVLFIKAGKDEAIVCFNCQNKLYPNEVTQLDKEMY